MKKILLTAALAMTCASAMAQKKEPEPYGPQYYSELRVQTYAKAIGLTPEQTKDLGAAFLKAEEAAAEHRKAAREAHEKAAAILAQTDLDVRRQLTKDQLLVLDSLQVKGHFMPEICSGVVLEGGCPRGYDKYGCAVPPKVKTKPQRVPLKEGYPEISPVQR